MNKRTFSTVGIGLLAILSACSCSRVAPDAGHEAVLVSKPWFFGHGGVDSTPITTGSTFVAVSTEAVMVSRLPIQVEEHFEDLMSLDGVPLDFDAVIRLQVVNSVELISRFGPDWYKTNVQAEFRNRVRQEVRKHGMNETAISSSAVDEIDNNVTNAVKEYLSAAKIPVLLLQVTLGKANPPDAIKNQRIETAAQQQRILSEQQRKLAEDQRKAAEKSRADADNAYREAMQLSPEQYLALERIKMQQSACTHGNCTFITGAVPGMVLGK